MKQTPIWPVSEDSWCQHEEKFIANEAGHIETIFTLANGYHGLRGVLDIAPHYGRPAAFFVNLFDKAPLHFDELANGPDWANIEVTANGTRLDPESCKLLHYRRTLDMRQGILFTSIRWEDARGRRSLYESCRLIHAVNKQRACVWGRITPENWSGDLIVSGGLNADTVTRIGDWKAWMAIRHLKCDRLEQDVDGISYEGHAYTYKSPLTMRSRLLVDGKPTQDTERRREALSEIHHVKAIKGKPVSFGKFVAFQAEPLKKGQAKDIVRSELKAMIRAGIESTASSHTASWAKRWRNADVQIDGNQSDQAAVRFSIFHLMQCACEKPLLDVSIAAKGLHGEGYHGHIFWDTEIFMLPFFAVTDPDVAKSLLLYRYRRLSGAREHAKKSGYRGAQFPWQSSVTGEEVTPWQGVDLIGHGFPPYEFERQHQVTASIALSVDWYRRMTGDEAFYMDYGTQILIETAQFWASRVELDPKRGKYVIKDLKCVDEYHFGVDNDAYTCFVAAENLRLGIQAAHDLKKQRPSRYKALCKEIGLTQKEIAQWREVESRMYFAMDPKTGMIEQFDGYFKLPDQTLKRDERGWPIYPKGEDLDAGRTQLIKQADVVLLFFLFGDRFADDIKHTNFMYYLDRDTHGSSLSANTYAIVGLEVNEPARAYQAFCNSAYHDLRPGSDNTGIHAACLGGTWQAVINGFAGMRLWGDKPTFKPWLPPQWNRLAFSILWRGSLIGLEMTNNTFSARLIKGSPLEIEVNGEALQVTHRKTTVPYSRQA